MPPASRELCCYRCLLSRALARWSCCSAYPHRIVSTAGACDKYHDRAAPVCGLPSTADGPTGRSFTSTMKTTLVTMGQADRGDDHVAFCCLRRLPSRARSSSSKRRSCSSVPGPRPRGTAGGLGGQDPRPALALALAPHQLRDEVLVADHLLASSSSSQTVNQQVLQSDDDDAQAVDLDFRARRGFARKPGGGRSFEEQVQLFVVPVAALPGKA